ncbi:intron-binding protein aquarius [Dorcoceras hygrometricum]|uniref:Intron-binding protein aquarius n=1 Tax=Dorcoceras hygrometricum TaxID=472368 RepID=A0A2Z7BMY7_9LAMI|nr:intron-binding protein aquarius [Dorcoceras hygrometricum]
MMTSAISQLSGISDDDVISDVITISSELSGISDDCVSSDVITISSWIRRSAKQKMQPAVASIHQLQEAISWKQTRATVQPVDGKPADSYSDLHHLVNQSLAHLDHQLMYQSQATVYQSQATVYQVAGYSVLHIQSTGNPDAGKADVVKSCKPDADSYNQTQRIQTQRS